MKQYELRARNLLFKYREPIDVSPRVGYINLDNESCDLAGTWPWKRNYHVALVKTLEFYGVTAAGYDVFFTEKMEQEFNHALLDAKKIDTSDIDALIDLTIRSFDDEFAQALKESKMIYLGAFLQQKEQLRIETTVEEYIETQKSFTTDEKKASMEVAKRFAFPISKSFRTVDRMANIVAPLPNLGTAAKGVGFEQIVPDNITGAVYQYPMFLEYDQHIYPALALLLVADHLGIDLSKTHGEPNGHLTFYPSKPYKQFKAEPFKVPVNDKMRMLMNWSGTFFGTFFHTNFKQLAHHYAYLQGKALIRRKNPSIEDAPQITENIKTLIKTENWVPAEEVDEIAENIAMGWVVEKMASENKDRNAILKELDHFDVEQKHREEITDAVMLAVHVSQSATPEDISKCQSELSKHDYLEFRDGLIPYGKYTSISVNHRLEIARNVLGFKNTPKYKDISPLYFPPCEKNTVNGKHIDISPTMLKDKLMMIGLEGEGTIDLNPQPYEESCAMVALHANAINTFLTRQFLEFEKAWETNAAMFLLAVLIGLISNVMPNRFSIPIILASVAGFTYYAYYQFSENGKLIHVVAPLITALLTQIAAEGLKLYFAYREKQKVKGMFGKMVSPDVLKVMSEDPDMFSLTGRRQACTSYFSSMEGFAEITKGVTPGEMIGLLGEYLTPASQIITSYHGYIDKYEGHIIMADFGVPIREETHMANCLYSCIEQQLDMQAFKTYIYARYGKHVNTSMGVNTGYVSAGNMGSDRKMQYTIMGDTVNTAARFRPANWIYDNLGSIIIGESTYPLVQEFIQVRTLDKLLLKGKLKPVNIYEVMGWEPEHYLKLRANVDISENLKICWAKNCPPEKIYGYALFWDRQLERTKNPLAKEISEFFHSKINIAAELTSLTMKKQICNNMENYLSQQEDISALTGKDFAPIAKGDWKTRLNSWKGAIAEQLGILDEKRKKDPELDKRHRDLTEVIEKVEALEERLGVDLDIAPELADAWNDIREFVGTEFESNTENFEEEYKDKYSDYEKEALAFIETVIPRMKEYHELLAVIGSKSESQVKLTEDYEKALQAQWQRDWDKAIEQFKNALNHAPEDKAAKCFISRVEGYKSKPPEDNWQGEYRQTKK